MAKDDRYPQLLCISVTICCIIALQINPIKCGKHEKRLDFFLNCVPNYFRQFNSCEVIHIQQGRQQHKKILFLKCFFYRFWPKLFLIILPSNQLQHVSTPTDVWHSKVPVSPYSSSTCVRQKIYHYFTGFWKTCWMGIRNWRGPWQKKGKLSSSTSHWHSSKL